MSNKIKVAKSRVRKIEKKNEKERESSVLYKGKRKVAGLKCRNRTFKSRCNAGTGVIKPIDLGQIIGGDNGGKTDSPKSEQKN